ncbi:WecB/TagA/CpsF family glycosyltransferase [Tissierella carlieri]|jgi:N-acetylglucosaminyldiphosphoundecaprenol N-acetyl-beta-D-mannosaminyltransferase|uniref:WecB/TagA/CpsF family glycosyltransferase n=1 Tax=Tissierella carlieri TaxID=689904 RepID=UPI002804C0FD|nr:WecB/TagA/CpsF family glycosyltransferase [uncultured Tissierella sp.]MDU5080366.1 WecB/TagA/CpsF family glycosyltransferase [Bacillota bacterium]
MDSIEIFGVKIHNITFDEATKEMINYLRGSELKTIYTPNTEIVMGAKDNEQLKGLINEGDLITADGIGLIYASRIKKKPLKERVTGYYLTIKLLDIANENNYSVYLLGCEDGVAKAAAENIKKTYPNIRIAGYHHGYFKGTHNGCENHEEEIKVINDINSSNPDIIFVGLGFPKQENWIDTNKGNIKGKIIIGHGGVMNILAGNTKSTPKIFEKLGLEWFYRLVKEPSRIKRQIVLPKFMLKVLFSKDVIK